MFAISVIDDPEITQKYAGVFMERIQLEFLDFITGSDSKYKRLSKEALTKELEGNKLVQNIGRAMQRLVTLTRFIDEF